MEEKNCNLYAMSESIIDPNDILNWITLTLDDFLKDSQQPTKINLDLNQPIKTIISQFDWNLWAWLLLVMTLEIEYYINIPDNIAAIENRLGDFISNISILKIQSDISWRFQRIHMLGNLEIYNELEKTRKTNMD